ncbi:MAG: hypothetical protein CVU77_05620 [Elusimicrobia bacterium HGW-Elusimicrobia-1]|jgi:tetratricopeptide (TPR) repeat protein|nr:MAG: hypothetical protein CVU77_05620 [Elusimicrobia bacterium HGW-Elusimicrobia-1]
MTKKKDKGPLDEVLEMSAFYMMNKRYDKAVEVLKSALLQNPDDAELNYNLGLNYEVLNKTEEAIEMFQKALAANPSHKHASEHLSKLMEIR